MTHSRLPLKRLNYVAVLAAALGLMPNLAGAVQVRVDFTAKVNHVQNAPVLGISPVLGDLATGFFTYDTNAPDGSPGDPTFGEYAGGVMSVTLGGSTFTNNLASQIWVHDINASNDLFTVIAGSGAGHPHILVNGVPTAGGQILFSFSEPTGGLMSDALPYPFPPGLEVSQFHLRESTGNRSVHFSNLQSFEVSLVPEPSSLAISGSGLFALAVYGWRRRTRARA